MAEDAKFEDGGEKPLRLRAEDAEDLQVISALTQDAIFPITEMKWEASRRRFSLLINRFRWEDKALAELRGRAVERVQAVLVFDDVMKVSSQGVERAESDMVLSLLAVEFEAGEDGTGRVILTLAGDGALALDVEAVSVTLQDVTRPYIAPSGKAPDHGE